MDESSRSWSSTEKMLLSLFNYATRASTYTEELRGDFELACRWNHSFGVFVCFLNAHLVFAHSLENPFHSAPYSVKLRLLQSFVFPSMPIRVAVSKHLINVLLSVFTMMPLFYLVSWTQHASFPCRLHTLFSSRASLPPFGAVITGRWRHPLLYVTYAAHPQSYCMCMCVCVYNVHTFVLFNNVIEKRNIFLVVLKLHIS